MPEHATPNPYLAPETIVKRSEESAGSLPMAWAKSAAEHTGKFIWAMPLLNYLYVCFFWLLTSLLLGEWARPGVHDPKDVLGGVPNLVHIVLTVLSLGILPVVLVCGFVKNRLRGLLDYLIGFLSCLVVSVGLFRIDLWQITSWISD